MNVSKLTQKPQNIACPTSHSLLLYGSVLLPVNHFNTASRIPVALHGNFRGCGVNLFEGFCFRTEWIPILSGEICILSETFCILTRQWVSEGIESFLGSIQFSVGKVKDLLGLILFLSSSRIGSSFSTRWKGSKNLVKTNPQPGVLTAYPLASIEINYISKNAILIGHLIRKQLQW